MAEQEGEVVADSALFVVQVGMTDPAGLYLHHGLAGSGIGYDDRLDPDRFVLPGAITPRTSCAMVLNPFVGRCTPPTLRVTDR